jgi:hypothetical protein
MASAESTPATSIHDRRCSRTPAIQAPSANVTGGSRNTSVFALNCRYWFAVEQAAMKPAAIPSLRPPICQPIQVTPSAVADSCRAASRCTAVTDALPPENNRLSRYQAKIAGGLWSNVSVYGRPSNMATVKYTPSSLSMGSARNGSVSSTGSSAIAPYASGATRHARHSSRRTM